MPLNLAPIIPIYQRSINSLIEQLGKPVTCYFESTVSNLDPTAYDPIRGRNLKQPSYTNLNKSSKETINTTTQVVTCLVEILQTTGNVLGTRILEPSNRIQLKGFIQDVTVLKRCSYIKVDTSIIPFIDAKYKLVSEPIPVGLRYNVYAITIWERA